MQRTITVMKEVEAKFMDTLSKSSVDELDDLREPLYLLMEDFSKKELEGPSPNT